MSFPGMEEHEYFLKHLIESGVKNTKLYIYAFKTHI